MSVLITACLCHSEVRHQHLYCVTKEIKKVQIFEESVKNFNFDVCVCFFDFGQKAEEHYMSFTLKASQWFICLM